MMNLDLFQTLDSYINNDHNVMSIQNPFFTKYQTLKKCSIFEYGFVVPRSQGNDDGDTYLKH